MSFKKVNQELLFELSNLEISEPNELQKKVLPKIKSGANLFIEGEKGSGKTTALIISVLDKLNFKEGGDNPRVVIFMETRDEVIELEAKFKEIIKYREIRTFPIFEQGDIDHQKNTIYPGMDILISTPKRFSKLYFLNGINLSELQLIMVDDADFLTRGTAHTDIDRLAESLKKCQFVVFTDKYTPRYDRLKDLFMKNAELISAK